MREQRDKDKDEIIVNTMFYPECITCGLFAICTEGRDGICEHFNIACRPFAEWNVRLYDNDEVGDTDGKKYVQ